MNRWAELVGAATLLTRLPVAEWTARHSPAAACVWAYPPVGGLVGLAGAAALAAGLAVGLPQPLAAAWVLAATVLLTGGLHEDGLADTADGLGGGATLDRKLAIMRDSRIGSYGALALLFSLLIRGTALASSAHPVQALVLAGVLGRGAMMLPLLLLRPARDEGLGRMLASRPHGAVLVGLGLGALPFAWAPVPTVAAFAAAAAATVAMARALGGYTGDTLGATEQLAECVTLSALAV